MRQLVFLVSCLIAVTPAWAIDGVPARIEAAKAAYARGDLARTALELEAAVQDLQARIGRSLGEMFPAIPTGWQAEPPETQGLASAGGGMEVSRAYSRDEATLNASLIIDSPAVASAALQFAANAPMPPNVRRIKVGPEDALLRWDAANRSGEVTIILGARVLLQLECDNLANSDVLTEAAKGWNLAGIRKAVGG